jgi:hypothetical protein
MNKVKDARKIIKDSKCYLPTIAVWFILWTSTQGFFINTAWLNVFSSDPATAVLLASLYCLVIMLIVGVIFRKHLSAIFPRQRFIWLYILIVPAIAYMLVVHPTVGVLSTPVYLFMIMITVFWQDVLTFGALQSRLERINPKYAWLIVAVVFWLGHIVFDLSGVVADPSGTLLVLVAAFSFAWLRKVTGSFYLPNVLHLLFYMILP